MFFDSRKTFLSGKIALVAFLMFFGTQSLAADLLPMTNVDANATGQVSSAETSRPGEINSGVEISSSREIISQETFGMEVSDEELGRVIESSHRAGVFLGFGLTRKIEFTLGIHGTYEDVDPQYRDELFVEEEDEGEEAGWHGTVKQTGFSGASLLVKMRLLKTNGFSMALAPFIESGASDRATYALTRSVNPRAGWMAIMTYGMGGIAEISLNGGYRYRDPESIGNLIIRNEAFYKGIAKINITYNLSVFVSGQGRRLMVAKNNEGKVVFEDEGKKYEAVEGNEIGGGITTYLGDSNLSVYVASPMENHEGIGYGKTSAGMSISFPVGSYKGRKHRTSIASDIERREENKDDEAKKAKKAAKKKEENQYFEMTQDEIDPLKGLVDEEDDFRMIEKKIADESSKKTSEDDLIDQEISKLRKAEEKAEADRKVLEKKKAEKKRKVDMKEDKVEEERRQEYMQDANSEADDFQGISDEELNWNGLE